MAVRGADVPDAGPHRLPQDQLTDPAPADARRLVARLDIRHDVIQPAYCHSPAVSLFRAHPIGEGRRIARGHVASRLASPPREYWAFYGMAHRVLNSTSSSSNPRLIGY